MTAVNSLPGTDAESQGRRLRPDGRLTEAVKTFISAADIETLAAQGVRELAVDEDTVLTAIARETAAQLGVKLLAPGASRPATWPSGSGLPQPRPRVSGKPKGCQHGPLNAGRLGARPGHARPLRGPAPSSTN